MCLVHTFDDVGQISDLRTYCSNVYCFAMNKNYPKIKDESDSAYAFAFPQNQRTKLIQANKQLLLRQIKRGFRPKWYCVFHLNNTINTNDEILLDRDLIHTKNMLYSELYGGRWKKVKKKARGFWTLEFGSGKDRPHMNLLIETLPFPYDDYRSSFVLFHRILPRDVKCVWKRTAHIQPVDLFDADGLYQYVVKESDFDNSTLLDNLTDWIL